jgi:hypothetical protein
MARIIKLTESDLEQIVKKVLKEQTGPGITSFGPVSQTKETPNKKLQSYEVCVPETLRGFILYVMSNKDTLMKTTGVGGKVFLQMVKASIGIIGRETKYGEYTETGDIASEFLRRNGLGGLVNFAINSTNTVRGVMGKGKITQSLGLAQFTPETWKKYGLDKTVGPYDESLDSTKQGLGTLFKLSSEYQKALKSGLNPDVPSQNQILQNNGIISKINGTGNNALDASIVAHNMTAEKLLTKYCTTNNPLYAAPCNLPTYSPFESQESFNKNKSTKLLNSAKVDQKYKTFPGKLIVNKNNILPGYFPNLKGPNHTGIGYLEEVVQKMNTLNCF